MQGWLKVEHTAVRAITRPLWVSGAGLGTSMPSGGHPAPNSRPPLGLLLCLPGQERSCGLLPGAQELASSLPLHPSKGS